MPPRRVGLRTLGLAILAAGLLMLYTQQTGIRINLARFWPLLLILLGIEMLFVHSRAGTGGRVRVSLTSVTLIALVIILATANLSGGGISCGPSSCGPVTPPANITHREHRGEIAVDWTGVERLVVSTQFGAISIEATLENQSPSLTVDITGYGVSLADARQAATGADVSVERTGGQLTLRGTGERLGTGNTRASVSLALRVPANVAVALSSEHGSIVVTGIQNETTLRSRYGSVDAANIVGPVTIEADHGAVDARRVDGSLSVNATYGRIEASAITGPVSIDAKHGRVDLRGPGSVVTVIATYGSVNVRYEQRLPAACTLESRFGAVSLELPRDSQFTLDAYSARARVSVGFSGPGVTQQGSSYRAQGDVNGGGELVRLESEYARIDVRSY